jgi:hypothetical protein
MPGPVAVARHAVPLAILYRRSRNDRRPVEETAEPEARERRGIRAAAHHPRDQFTGAGTNAEAMSAEAGRDEEIRGFRPAK